MRLTAEQYAEMQARGRASFAKPAEVPEKDIHADIEDWLKTKGAWYCHSRMDARTTTRRGVPDFLILWSGKFYGIEVKRIGQKAKPHQLGELRWIEREGGRVGVAHSLDEFKSILGVTL